MYDFPVHLDLNLTSLNSPLNPKKAMYDLVWHPGFRASHLREDIFVPIDVAGGAWDDEDVTVIFNQYGTASFAFGSSWTSMLETQFFKFTGQVEFKVMKMPFTGFSLNYHCCRAYSDCRDVVPPPE